MAFGQEHVRFKQYLINATTHKMLTVVYEVDKDGQRCSSVLATDGPDKVTRWQLRQIPSTIPITVTDEEFMRVKNLGEFHTWAG